MWKIDWTRGEEAWAQGEEEGTRGEGRGHGTKGLRGDKGLPIEMGFDLAVNKGFIQ